MSIFRISREDLLRAKTISPGWYVTTIRDVVDGQAKKDASDLTTVTLVVDDGPFVGVLLQNYMSHKTPGFHVKFLEAVLGEKVPEDGAEFDLQKAIGRKIWTYVKNDQYQGRLINKVASFEHYTPGQTQPPVPSR